MEGCSLVLGGSHVPHDMSRAGLFREQTRRRLTLTLTGVDCPGGFAWRCAAAAGGGSFSGIAHMQPPGGRSTVFDHYGWQGEPKGQPSAVSSHRTHTHHHPPGGRSSAFDHHQRQHEEPPQPRASADGIGERAGADVEPTSGEVHATR